MNLCRLLKLPSLMVLVLITVGTTRAGESEFRVIGPTALSIPAEKATANTATLPDIAIIKRPIDAAWTSTLRTVSVLHDGRAVHSDIFDFALELDESGAPVLRTTVDLKRARDAGDYTVTLWITHEGSGAPALQEVVLTFTRPLAELRVDTPVHIERVITIPFGAAPPISMAVNLAEVGGRGSFTPAQHHWFVALRDVMGRPVEGRLGVSVPQDGVDAWSQDDLELEVTGPLPLGSVTGTVTVRSRQIPDRLLEFTVEVVSRHHRIWLVIAIALGIVLGLQVRVYLENRQQRIRARIAAEDVRGRLRALIDDTADHELGERLECVLRDLAKSIEDPLTNVEALTKAAEDASEKTERLLEKADQERASLGGRIATLRASIGVPEGQPPEIARFLEETLGRLADHEQALTRGSIRPVATRLDAEEQSLPVQLQERTNGWLTEVANSVNRMGSWPGTDFDDVVRELQNGIAEVRDKVAGPLEAGAIAGWLERTRALVQRARHDLLTTGLTAIVERARTVLDRLEKEKDHTLAGALNQLQTNLATLDGEQRDVAQLPRLADAVYSLRTSIVAALSAALPKPTSGDVAAPPTPLEESDFEVALEWVIKQREPQRDRSLGGATPFAAAEGAAMVGPSTDARWQPVLAIPPTWALMITTTPQRPRAGEPVFLNAHVVVPRADVIAPQVAVSWEVAGQPSARGLPAEVAHTFTPRRSGPLVVRAKAVDPASGSSMTTVIALQIHPHEGFAAVTRLSKRLRLFEALEMAVAGVLIASAGFAIFESTFVGAYGDYLAALLWGFSVDIGVARVRELAAPLVGRALPGTGAK